jgi:hypothetical protein
VGAATGLERGLGGAAGLLVDDVADLRRVQRAARGVEHAQQHARLGPPERELAPGLAVHRHDDVAVGHATGPEREPHVHLVAREALDGGDAGARDGLAVGPGQGERGLGRGDAAQLCPDDRARQHVDAAVFVLVAVRVLGLDGAGVDLVGEAVGVGVLGRRLDRRAEAAAHHQAERARAGAGAQPDPEPGGQVTAARGEVSAGQRGLGGDGQRRPDLRVERERGRHLEAHAQRGVEQPARAALQLERVAADRGRGALRGVRVGGQAGGHLRARREAVGLERAEGAHQGGRAAGAEPALGGAGGEVERGDEPHAEVAVGAGAERRPDHAEPEVGQGRPAAGGGVVPAERVRDAPGRVRQHHRRRQVEPQAGERREAGGHVDRREVRRGHEPRALLGFEHEGAARVLGDGADRPAERRAVGGAPEPQRGPRVRVGGDEAEPVGVEAVRLRLLGVGEVRGDPERQGQRHQGTGA